jgi:hypothetical protein
MRTKFQILSAGMLLAPILTGFGQPIIISNQPQSSTNLAGTTAAFLVGATGTEPLAYQWQKYGADFADLADRTNATLVLTNVVCGDAGDYRVVVTNIEGAVTSPVARLTVVAYPPRIIPTTSLQHHAVQVGSNASFTVQASGLALWYQWRLDGRELLGQTQKTFAITNAQPTDEGGYSAVVTNLAGTMTSEPARLWVVPPATEFIKGNFTNTLGRLPYFYLLPTNYTAAQTYPLLVMFHGTPGDETVMTTPNYGYPGYLNLPGVKMFACCR